MKHLVKYRLVRFLIDFWFDDPIRALRHHTQKRTWPSPAEFARMTDSEFRAYLESIGARRPVPA